MLARILIFKMCGSLPTGRSSIDASEVLEMSVASVLQKVKEAVKAKATEPAQRNAVATVLARHGSVKTPKVEMARQPDGATVRVYKWLDTPAGDFCLITGPSIIAEVHDLRSMDPSSAPKGVYIKGADAPMPVQKKVERKITKELKKTITKELKKAPHGASDEAMQKRLAVASGKLAHRLNPEHPTTKGSAGALDRLKALVEGGYGGSLQAQILRKALTPADEERFQRWMGARLSKSTRRNPVSRAGFDALDPATFDRAVSIIAESDPELAAWIRQHPEKATASILGSVWEAAVLDAQAAEDVQRELAEDYADAERPLHTSPYSDAEIGAALRPGGRAAAPRELHPTRSEFRPLTEDLEEYDYEGPDEGPDADEESVAPVVSLHAAARQFGGRVIEPGTWIWYTGPAGPARPGFIESADGNYLMIRWARDLDDPTAPAKGMPRSMLMPFGYLQDHPETRNHGSRMFFFEDWEPDQARRAARVQAERERGPIEKAEAAAAVIAAAEEETAAARDVGPYYADLVERVVNLKGGSRDKRMSNYNLDDTTDAKILRQLLKEAVGVTASITVRRYSMATGMNFGPPKGHKWTEAEARKIAAVLPLQVHDRTTHEGEKWIDVGTSIYPHAKEDRSDFQSDYHSPGGPRIATAYVPLAMKLIAKAAQADGYSLTSEGQAALVSRTKRTMSGLAAPVGQLEAEAKRLGVKLPEPGPSYATGTVFLSHTPETGTIAKGDTRAVKDVLKASGMRWYKAGGFWYVPKSRDKHSAAIDLFKLAADLRRMGAKPEVQAMLKEGAQPIVTPEAMALAPFDTLLFDEKRMVAYRKVDDHKKWQRQYHVAGAADGWGSSGPYDPQDFPKALKLAQEPGAHLKLPVSPNRPSFEAAAEQARQMGYEMGRQGKTASPLATPAFGALQEEVKASHGLGMAGLLTNAYRKGWEAGKAEYDAAPAEAPVIRTQADAERAAASTAPSLLDEPDLLDWIRGRSGPVYADLIGEKRAQHMAERGLIRLDRGKIVWVAPEDSDVARWLDTERSRMRTPPKAELIRQLDFAANLLKNTDPATSEGIVQKVGEILTAIEYGELPSLLVKFPELKVPSPSDPKGTSFADDVRAELKKLRSQLVAYTSAHEAAKPGAQKKNLRSRVMEKARQEGYLYGEAAEADYPDWLRKAPDLSAAEIDKLKDLWSDEVTKGQQERELEWTAYWDKRDLGQYINDQLADVDPFDPTQRDLNRLFENLFDEDGAEEIEKAGFEPKRIIDVVATGLRQLLKPIDQAQNNQAVANMIDIAYGAAKERLEKSAAAAEAAEKEVVNHVVNELLGIGETTGNNDGILGLGYIRELIEQGGAHRLDEAERDLNAIEDDPVSYYDDNANKVPAAWAAEQEESYEGGLQDQVTEAFRKRAAREIVYLRELLQAKREGKRMNPKKRKNPSKEWIEMNLPLMASQYAARAFGKGERFHFGNKTTYPAKWYAKLEETFGVLNASQLAAFDEAYNEALIALGDATRKNPQDASGAEIPADAEAGVPGLFAIVRRNGETGEDVTAQALRDIVGAPGLKPAAAKALTAKLGPSLSTGEQEALKKLGLQTAGEGAYLGPWSKVVLYNDVTRYWKPSEVAGFIKLLRRGRLRIAKRHGDYSYRARDGGQVAHAPKYSFAYFLEDTERRGL